MTETVSGEEYERRIMAARAAGEPAPDVAPPADYELSAAFQKWLVDRMRAEILGDMSDAMGAVHKDG